MLNSVFSLSSASDKHPQKKSKEGLSKAEQEVLAVQERIFESWQQVWLGLYHLYDDRGPQHVERLRELYRGAGMSTSLARAEIKQNKTGKESSPPDDDALGLLGFALAKKGIGALRLFDGLPAQSLQPVIQLVEAYKKEISGLQEIYRLLRSLQVGFRAPTSDDETAVLEQYLPLADELASRLLHLDAKTLVLVSQLQDEHWELHKDVVGRRGWTVHSKVYAHVRNGSSMKYISG